MDAPIRSESAVNLMHTIDEFRDKKLDTIVLHTRRRNYPIKIENFLRHSKSIQQMAPNFPRVVDLTCYNVEAVRTLADYLCDVDVRNFRLSGSMLLDLLQLCRIFEISGLKEFLSVYIIENIEQGRDSPSAFVFNVTMVMSDWTLLCDDRVRQRLYAMAALLFPQIQGSSYLAKFPLSLMVQLLGRCDLRINHEHEVALIALKWLQLQTFTLDDVQVIFSTIRTPFLNASERKEIDMKAAEMGFVVEVIEVLNHQLNSTRNARCCVIKDHARSDWKRCGIPKDYIDKRFVQTFSFIDLRLVIPRAAQGDSTTYYEHQIFDCDVPGETPQSSGQLLRNLKVDEFSGLQKKLEESVPAAATSTAIARKDISSEILSKKKRKVAATARHTSGGRKVPAVPVKLATNLVPSKPAFAATQRGTVDANTTSLGANGSNGTGSNGGASGTKVFFQDAISSDSDTSPSVSSSNIPKTPGRGF